MKFQTLKHKFALLALCFALGSVTYSCAQPRTEPEASAPVPGGLVDLTYAAEKAVNSVVYIQVTINSRVQAMPQGDPFSDFFGDFFGYGGRGQRRQEMPMQKRQAAGSGVIISKDGYIVTNNHVVENADELNVKLNDNSEYKARIIGTDKNTDLALIKIEGKNFPAIKIGNSDKLKIGEWVLAVGNPFNLTSTVTAGIVSAKARSLGANGMESFIQTDAAINQGNSGGALVNVRGELVGINSMLYSQTGSYAGYGFAIPTSIMNKVVDDLKKYGTVQRALVGILGTDATNYIDSEKAKGKEVDLGTFDGVYVSEVSVDGAAETAGVKTGDVIIAIDGKKITKMAELQEAIVKKKPGDVINITYLRNKKEYTTKATLRNMQGTTTVLENVDVDGLGIALKPISTETQKALNLNYGLEVSAIRSGSMQRAGISKGMIILQVNDRKMNKTEDFNEVVKAANMSTERVLWIRAKTQSGLSRSFAIELGKKK